MDYLYEGLEFFLKNRDKKILEELENFQMEQTMSQYNQILGDEKTMINNIISTFGREPQMRQVQEECAELIHAINKYLRDPSPQNHARLESETIDVTVMMLQMLVLVEQYDTNNKSYPWGKIIIEKLSQVNEKANLCKQEREKPRGV